MQDAAPSDPAHLPDDSELWRRIPPGPSWAKYDQNEGRIRPSSGAFRDKPGESISAFIAGESGGVEVVLHGHDGFALVRFTLGLVRACGLTVVRDLTGGPGHVLLKGGKDGRVTVGGESLRVKDALAKHCEWVGDPPAVT